MIAEIDEILEWFKNSCKPQSQRKIGFESERLGVYTSSAKSIPYQGGEQSVRRILEILEKDHKFKLVYEQDNPIGADNHLCKITLEPGAQFEVSVEPEGKISRVIKKFLTINNILCEITQQLKFNWLACGCNPFTPCDEIEMIPKKRYQIMKEYFKSRGYLAEVMMKATNSIHFCIDYRSEQDMSKLIRIAYSISPVLVGMFANSYYCKDVKTANLNKRNLIWRNTDDDRCGVIPGVLSGKFSFKDYIDYALEVPMMFRYEKEKQDLKSAYGMKFSDYIKTSPDQQITPEDIFLHLSGLFPMIRLRNYLEIRCIDALPLRYKLGVPGFLGGLFYSDRSLEKIEALIEQVDEDNLNQGIVEASEKGLRGRYLNRKIQNWSEILLNIAQSGLDDVIEDKSEKHIIEKYMDNLYEIIKSGNTPSEKLIEAVQQNGFSPDTLIEYEGLRFCPEAE
ncbi:MAG: hypothetical protein APR63_12700 [Desulfuromonas sp. SDB]|nr:MAG: hypothetical protein APR63_12700 [Desulfuromonas sp. SDB]